MRDLKLDGFRALGYIEHRECRPTFAIADAARRRRTLTTPLPGRRVVLSCPWFGNRRTKESPDARPPSPAARSIRPHSL
jgi:hypothetical protein